MTDEYKALLADVRRHARLVVEAAEDIDSRAMDIHVFELRELQQRLIILEMMAAMSPEQRRDFEERAAALADD